MNLKRLLTFIFFILVTSSTLRATTASVKDTLLTDSASVTQKFFPKDLKELYAGSEYVYEINKNTTGWFTRFKEWLSQKLKSFFDIRSDADAAQWADILLYTFCAIVFVSVVFIIVKLIMNKEGRWVFGRSSDKKLLSVKDIENNLQVTDFNVIIADAVKNNEFRLAVRYYYLWSLKLLAAKGLIQYDVEKTNTDYLAEIKNAPVKNQFAYTAYLYNYIWYGEFPVDGDGFAIAAKKFKTLINSLS